MAAAAGGRAGRPGPPPPPPPPPAPPPSPPAAPPVPEYLKMDLATGGWRCRRGGQDRAPARGSYRGGTLVHDRDPGEIPRPLIDPTRYEFTFAPDPPWCRILEYYCPGCGTQVEAEYLPPGHPPVYDMQIDVDALQAQWAARPAGTLIPLGRDATAEPL